MPKKRRVMLKLSGEALSGDKGFGFDDYTIQSVAREVRKALEQGVELAVVIGGGNFWRGRNSEAVPRYKADQVGMLATVMNCIYVSEIFRSEGIPAFVMSSIAIGDMAELFHRDRALALMAEGNVMFLAGGTGHPYFTTDTGVVLRAIELECDEVLLAKSIDAVYDSDPAENPAAVRFSEISIGEVMERRLKVIDLAASALCIDNHMPLRIFSLKEPDGILRALRGENIGTVVSA